MTDLINNYIKTINALPKSDIDAALKNVYADEVVFIDPAHKVIGLEKLTAYFKKLYQNASYCNFTLQNCITEGQHYSLQWVMVLSHNSLKKGAEITVNGASFLEYNDKHKIIQHQDYFDLGAMLYENVPLIGSITKFIKGKL